MNRGASTHEKNAPVVWTDDLQKALEHHIKSGLSASKTALKLERKFRIGITRHAVIGRANRTGVHFKPNKFDPKKGRKRMMQEAVALKPSKPRRERGGFPKLIYSNGREVVQPKQLDEPKARGDVDGGCRYMHGESRLRNFCGAPSDPRHESWCPHHLGRMFHRN